MAEGDAKARRVLGQGVYEEDDIGRRARDLRVRPATHAVVAVGHARAAPPYPTRPPRTTFIEKHPAILPLSPGRILASAPFPPVPPWRALELRFPPATDVIGGARIVFEDPVEDHRQAGSVPYHRRRVLGQRAASGSHCTVWWGVSRPRPPQGLLSTCAFATRPPFPPTSPHACIPSHVEACPPDEAGNRIVPSMQSSLDQCCPAAPLRPPQAAAPLPARIRSPISRAFLASDADNPSLVRVGYYTRRTTPLPPTSHATVLPPHDLRVFRDIVVGTLQLYQAQAHAANRPPPEY
ncbi:hypothetical protein B0H15DRAFT_956811 [Mycena belliarum]|uniref:Uncharacterized protein n=1 Tax=Mycena belliarum TaxID=1033014 RepID=A0AAD6XH97_9AGAR|nr:hypothetical protein B0H15DRAFT_956811 [Mycena belliae]